MNPASKIFNYLKITCLVLMSSIGLCLGIFTLIYRQEYGVLAGFKAYPVALTYHLPLDLNFSLPIWLLYGLTCLIFSLFLAALALKEVKKLLSPKPVFIASNNFNYKFVEICSEAVLINNQNHQNIEHFKEINFSNLSANLNYWSKFNARTRQKIIGSLGLTKIIKDFAARELTAAEGALIISREFRDYLVEETLLDLRANPFLFYRIFWGQLAPENNYYFIYFDCPFFKQKDLILVKAKNLFSLKAQLKENLQGELANTYKDYRDWQRFFATHNDRRFTN